MSKILEINNVTKEYTGHKALDNVSFDMEQGKVYGLLGPNGAGKTTLIRIINHITAPDSGSVCFNGKPLTASDVAQIGYLPEERGLYKKMKVGDQALFFAQLKGLSRREAMASLKEWFDRLGIADWWGKKVEELSKGMAQKVQFIVTVLHRPKLLIFDEPFSGFDPVNAEVLKQEILRLRDEGASIIFSTHNMASVEEICDDITLLNNGRNILTGNVETIRRDFSDGLFDFTVTRPHHERLRELLAPLTRRIIVEPPVPGSDESTLKLRLAPDADVHSVIEIVNNNALIHSMARSKASMNEIFMRAVAQ